MFCTGVSWDLYKFCDLIVSEYKIYKPVSGDYSDIPKIKVDETKLERLHLYGNLTEK